MLPREVRCLIFSYLSNAQLITLIKYDLDNSDHEPILSPQDLMLITKLKYPRVTDQHLQSINFLRDPIKSILKLEDGKDLRYFVLGRIVINIDYYDDKIILYFESSGRLEMRAESECCDDNWFEFPDESRLDALIGQEITSIIEGKDYEDLPDHYNNRCQEYTNRHNIYIATVSDNTLKLYFINTSNGYYSGYFVIKTFI